MFFSIFEEHSSLMNYEQNLITVYHFDWEKHFSHSAIFIQKNVSFYMYFKYN